MSKEIAEIYKSVRGLSEGGADIVRSMLEKSFTRDLKPDQSFVTEVDLAVENYLRDFVERTYPDHGFVGEEKDDVLPDADYQWIADPIDGTQNLVHGIPTYGIVIGVFHKGEPIVGAINHPALDLSYHAAKGYGAYCNGQELKIRDDGLLDDGSIDPQEVLCISTRSIFERSNEVELFDSLVSKYPSHRVFYDIFSSTRAIEGQAGAVIEWNMKVWDFAATQIIIEEAGGSFELMRKVHKKDSPTMYSLLAGKPKVVAALKKELGGYKEISL